MKEEKFEYYYTKIKDILENKVGKTENKKWKPLEGNLTENQQKTLKKFRLI